MLNTDSPTVLKVAELLCIRFAGCVHAFDEWQGERYRNVEYNVCEKPLNKIVRLVEKNVSSSPFVDLKRIFFFFYLI